MGKRKLKPIKDRRPTKKIGDMEMYRRVAKETGFRKEDIRLVIKAISKITNDELCNGNAVSIKDLGVFYPMVKMGGNFHINRSDKPIKPVVVPKINFSMIVKNELKKIEVTQEQIDAQYED